MAQLNNNAAVLAAISLVMSFGFLCGAIIIISAVYNRLLMYGHASTAAAGSLFGIFSYFLTMTGLYINNIRIFDLRFAVITYVAVVFGNEGILWLVPFYMGGVYLTGGNMLLHITVLSYAIGLSVFKFKAGIKSALLLGGIVPILTVEPLLSNLMDTYDSQRLMIIGAEIVFSVAAAIVIFGILASRNLFGFDTLLKYFSQIAKKYSNISHFKIYKRRNIIRAQKEFFDAFELSYPSKGNMDYRMFLTVMRNDILAFKDEADIEMLFSSNNDMKIMMSTIKTQKNKLVQMKTKRTILGNIVGYICDISDTVGAEILLHETLKRDYLTGLPTSYVLSEELLRTAKNFKGLLLQINFAIIHNHKFTSLFGLEFENYAVKTAIFLLMKEFPDSKIYHIKKNEFMLVHFGLKSKNEAKDYVERIHTLFSANYTVNDKMTNYTVPMGILVSECPECATEENISKCIAKAVWAYEWANTEFKGGVYYFDEDDYNESVSRLNRAQALPQLIKEKNLFLSYQPVVDVKTARIYAYEVLTRVTGSMYMSTKQLIQDSLYTNSGVELDNAIAAHIISEIIKKGIKSNLFVNKLAQTPLLEEYMKISEYLKLSGNNLYLELTEYDKYNINQLNYMCSQMKAKGISFVLDDYGSGYSSPVLLANIMPLIVKIDIDLIFEIEKTRSKELIVKGIIDYCRDLGIKSLGEGVASQGELRKLIELGVDYVQGFYVGMPEIELLSLSRDIRNEIFYYSSLRDEAQKI